jgi:hypothetical protein
MNYYCIIIIIYYIQINIFLIDLILFFRCCLEILLIDLILFFNWDLKILLTLFLIKLKNLIKQNKLKKFNNYFNNKNKNLKIK